MPYAHISNIQLRQQLAARLGDTTNTFWTDTENGVYLTEALRAFGILTGFWRNRGILRTTNAQVFYDITTPTIGTPTLKSLLGFTVTDYNIIQSLQFHLLESAASQSSWNGTEMFTLADMQNAVQRRRDQFLADTGIVVTLSLLSVLSPPVGRQPLPDTIIDVRRVAWLGQAPIAYFNPVWHDDERLLTAADQGWSINSGIPEAYSIMAPPPLTLQLSPLPITNGQVELLTVNSGPVLNTPVAATVLGIPDDLTPAIKWGALADLLGKDGIARDPIRAEYCEQRYSQYVQLARLLPVIVHAEINGVPVIPTTLFAVESLSPTWENLKGTPVDVAIAAPYLLALSPVPNDVYSVTLDVVQKTPLPVADGDFIQVGREQLDMILDYAEHLALFKTMGTEWKATMRQANNFLAQSVTYNQRLSAQVRAALAASLASERQKESIQRRHPMAMGLGALKGIGTLSNA